MKKVIVVFVLLALMVMGHVNRAYAVYVSYGGVNNFFLMGFTNTGYSSYDWRFEPLKTDKERAMLKGDVKKVVTNITDKTEFCSGGYADKSIDTTYYDKAGHLTRIVAPFVDNPYSRVKLGPKKWIFVYSSDGLFTRYEEHEDVETSNGKEGRAHIYFMRRDNKNQLAKEEYRAFSITGRDKWEEFGTPQFWEFAYDAAGNLVGGKSSFDMTLTYKNGQLIKMQPQDSSKPVTYTYDTQGRMTGMTYFMMDGMDEVENFEITVTMTYNEKGYLSGATRQLWLCTSKWVRRKVVDKTVYTITYQYDQVGNWTKATMYKKQGATPRQLAVTINRAITYF